MPMEDKSYCKPLDRTEAHQSKMSSSGHQTSYVSKEKVISPPKYPNLKSQVKHKSQNQFSQPYLIPHHELMGCPVYGRKVQVKSLEDRQKPHVGSSSSQDDDELVKYMSKIPGYLQQVDKGKNIQERALNFGVLDWTRLEKWKYNERMPGRIHRKLPPSSSNSLSMARRPPRVSTTSPQRKQASPCRLHGKSSQEQKSPERVPRKFPKVQDFPDGERKHFHGKSMSSRSFSEIDIHRNKWKELDEKPISKIKALSIDRDKLSKLDTASVKEGGDLTHHHPPTEPQSIVLLVPNHPHKLSCSGSSQFLESRLSCDRQSEVVSGSTFYDYFSPQELHSGELVSEVPHSCPQPTIDPTNNDPATNSESSVTTSCIESDVSVSSCPAEKIMSPTPLKARKSNVSKFSLEPSVSTEPSKKTYDSEAAEEVEVKGRHPSPNRRFSFSLGRISRSFSFKDNAAVPQLSSTYTTVKSGPISSETSACRDKASNNGRARSSPLRRLIDPLMKPRSTHSAETLSVDSLKNVKNHDVARFQALLQLSIKNDLPFFKFVVDNSSDILAAAVKSIRSDDLSLTYSFYSVHELKKKSVGWMSQGSKLKKNCDFGYDTIGQMKMSTSYTPDSKAQASTESVLFGVDPRKENLKASELVTRTEIAAIVVKTPVENITKGEESDGDQCKQKNDNFSSTMVILPGGVHGLPNQGAPSSLIKRWRSGGSCDCGGWDIGCKLRIFTNQVTTNNTLMPSVYSCDRVNLFTQGGEEESKPIFSLAPFKNGLYSVEFNASISLLEAFSICVATITTQRFYNIFELKSPAEVKRFSEFIAGNDRTRTPTTNQGQVPGKYVSSPPPSPVGRI